MNYVIKNVSLVNEGVTSTVDIAIKNGLFDKIAPSLTPQYNFNEIDGSQLIALPGLIDDQVHFREPGLTHKGEIYTEAKFFEQKKDSKSR